MPWCPPPSVLSPNPMLPLMPQGSGLSPYEHIDLRLCKSCCATAISLPRWLMIALIPTTWVRIALLMPTVQDQATVPRCWPPRAALTAFDTVRAERQSQGLAQPSRGPAAGILPCTAPSSPSSQRAPLSAKHVIDVQNSLRPLEDQHTSQALLAIASRTAETRAHARRAHARSGTESQSS